MPKPLLRTASDDIKDSEVKVEDLLPREPVDALAYDAVCVLLETIHGEMERLVGSANPQCNALVQSVKGNASIIKIRETIFNFFQKYLYPCQLCVPYWDASKL